MSKDIKKRAKDYQKIKGGALNRESLFGREGFETSSNRGGGKKKFKK